VGIQLSRTPGDDGERCQAERRRNDQDRAQCRGTAGDFTNRQESGNAASRQSERHSADDW
jgi:hypothetical protein